MLREYYGSESSFLASYNEISYIFIIGFIDKRMLILILLILINSNTKIKVK